MELGLFMMPLHPPARPVYDTYQENADKIILADKLGFTEAWVGQHFTAATENIPSPLMFMSWLLTQTRQIKFATGVLNLPCFNPAVVAAEVAQFDHMSRGRFIFGIGGGALAHDFALFNNPDGKVREEKVHDSIDIITKIWSQDPPYNIQGKYWSVVVEKDISRELGAGYMLKPYQKPHPEICFSVMSPFSSSAVTAGKRGWNPISANFIPTYSVASHWRKFVEGCDAVGRKPDPSKWRVARNIVVARTDEEAREMVYSPKGGSRYYFDYLWQVLKIGNYTVAIKPDPKTSDDDISVDMLLEDMVIYGSPKTVADKIMAFREKVGPFGKLMLAGTDWSGDRAFEESSMTLLGTQVAPLLDRAVPKGAAA